MSDYNEVDRVIYLNKHPGISESNHMIPLTTVFYPDDQISSYQRKMASTTPMPGGHSHNNKSNGTFLGRLFEDAEAISSVRTTVTWHPSNHKRQNTKVHHNNANDFEADTIEFGGKKSTELVEKRTIFPDDDYDYADSYQNVNSIQDILNQNSNNNNNDNENINNEELILPSMPFVRKMKVEGIYRREKNKRDPDFSVMETVQNGEFISSAQNKNSEFNSRKLDPFSKFKPTSPSDVNSLVSNVIKFKPQFSQHKPRPLTTATTLNKYYEDHYSDPNIIYHQIISANNKNRDATAIRNGRLEKPLKNNKPFSLMLDVYPMPEDETQDISTSTRLTPYTKQNPYQYQYHRPSFYHPMNSHAINHNLQYTRVYNNLKFPQLQQYSPYSRSPPYAVMNQNPKDSFYQSYQTHRMNTNLYRPSMKPPSPQSSSSSYTIPTDEEPSQITVHLNLYPDRKKYQTRNVQILEADSTIPPNTSGGSGSDSGSGSRTDFSFWKRQEQQQNNLTKFNSADVQPNPQTAYIPPFSAIKINTLHRPFEMNNDSNSLSHSEPVDKSIEYDTMVSFDSKKLVPNTKSAQINPTANAIVSTSSPYFTEISSTIPTQSMPSTMPNDFESTMSSSMFTSPTNHFPFYSSSITKLPFQTTVAAVTEVLDDNKLNESTTMYANTIRFPHH